MRILSLGTREYDVDIEKLFQRRLKQAGLDKPITYEHGDEQVLTAQINTPEEQTAWLLAISRLLLKDMAHFEMARIVNDMPISLAQKQAVLPEAMKIIHPSGAEGRVLRSLKEHYEEYEHLNLEGFVRFRMQDVLRSFALCADRASEEMLLRSEYLELMGVLSAYVKLIPPRMREINLILHPDGSCTLTDEGDSRIDCEECSDETVINMLIKLSPAKITVYDLTGKSDTLFSEALRRVFLDRVKFYN